jgi:1-acyl-sn-glycerol-3-phosphate acyltransferase
MPTSRNQADMLRKILRGIVTLIFRLLSHMEVSGMENVPAQGGVLMAANHMSRIDPPLVFTLLEREDATVLAADTYKRNPLFRVLLNAVNVIWINREEADIDALRAARDFLRAGGLLGISPEGTRSRVGSLIHAKTGIAYLADKARVSIIPVAISGTESAFRQLGRFHRPHFRVQIGKPFTLPPIERRNRDESLQRNTDEIMCHIAAMLPPQYWGVYAEHPRLRELLAQPESLDLAPPAEANGAVLDRQSA